MAAIDTIAAYQGTVASTLAAGVMATGDAASVRALPDGGTAKLIAAFYDAVTTPLAARLRSPSLADPVRGIQFNPGAAAPANLFPSSMPQPMQSQDALTFELSTAASTGKALLAVSIYYNRLGGIAARLFNPGDILPIVRNIKPVLVSVGSGANTAGQWYDLALNTTEDLLKADTDYAVLGLQLDVAVAALAIKGPETGGLRCAAPGGTNNPYASDWFVRLSEKTNMPCIPVINSGNKTSTFVSLISSAATGAASSFTVFLAELSSKLPQAA